MEDNAKNVEKQIFRNNPWYIGSHFEWAQADSIKRIYDKRYSYINNIVNKEIARKGVIKLLDYGCGDGYWSWMLSQTPHCSVTGVDYNPLRLKRAKKAAQLVNFYQADLTQASGLLEKFDILLCSQVIEHVDDDIGFLGNLKNFIKDDGRLILGTPNEGCFTQRLRRMYMREETDHCHFYKEKEIVSKLTGAGFLVKDIFREVFYPGHDKVYYKLTSSDAGFKFLEFCTKIMPSQCSDYYFDCVKL